MKKSVLQNIVLVLVFFIGLVSCKKEQGTPSHKNVWVESKGRADTIAFIDNSLLLLSRPKILTGAHLLPKTGSGPYTYQSLKDSIALQYSLSSLYAPKKYAYRVDGDKLYIGDFYEKTSATLMFEKVK